MSSKPSDHTIIKLLLLLPRVLIEATNERGKADRALRAKVAAALGRSGKLTVVASKEMKRRLSDPKEPTALRCFAQTEACAGRGGGERDRATIKDTHEHLISRTPIPDLRTPS